MKLSAPEDISAQGVMTSSEATSSEATFHQKLKFVKSYIIWSFKSSFMDRSYFNIGRRL